MVLAEYAATRNTHRHTAHCEQFHAKGMLGMSYEKRNFPHLKSGETNKNSKSVCPKKNQMVPRNSSLEKNENVSNAVLHNAMMSRMKIQNSED